MKIQIKNAELTTLNMKINNIMSQMSNVQERLNIKGGRTSVFNEKGEAILAVEYVKIKRNKLLGVNKELDFLLSEIKALTEFEK